MSRMISDPDVALLAALAGTLRADYPNDLAWEGSPFAWIKLRPARQVGAIGENLIAGWLASKGCDVIRSRDSDADRVVNGHRIEIKFSTLWATGVYKFQQLRDQDYAFAFCLGVSPFEAHAWLLPKAEILRRWRDRDGIHTQHGGEDGSDTAWLSLTPGAPPDWMGQYGGRLSNVAALLPTMLQRAR